jgi:hypothetical protein
MKDTKRRYPRVFLNKGVEEFEKIMGLEVEWPDGIHTGVLDISYIGAAIAKNSKVKISLQKGDRVPFVFCFADQDKKIMIDSEVIREDERSLAVYFLNLTLPGRQTLEKFLKQKLIGLNTHLIDPKFYIKEQGFDYWFHGPNQTNIFIWGTKDEIRKATFEVNYEVISYEDGEFFLSESKEFLEVPTEDYAYRVNNPESKKPLPPRSKHISEILSLLSQVQDTTGAIKTLIQKVAKK